LRAIRTDSGVTGRVGVPARRFREFLNPLRPLSERVLRRAAAQDVADLLARLGRVDEAASAYDRAIELATNAAERRFLTQRRDGAVKS